MKDASFVFGHGGDLPPSFGKDLACHVMALVADMESLQMVDEQLKVACRRAENYKAALNMIAQVRAVCGSAQGALRSNLAIADAALAGADLSDEETVIKVCEGKWQFFEGS